MRIQGATAVVTGAGSGIGRAVAERLAEEGARVVVTDIDLAAATGVAERIGGEAHRIDVTDAAEVEALAAAVVERHGGVDLVVANAGVASTAPLADMTDADWDWLLGVNLYGLVHTVRAFLPHLRRSRGAVLVSGSMAGLSPDPGMGGYGTTKFAVTAYTEVLAAEVEPDGIGVTLLAPGPVRTALGSSSRNRPGGAADGAHSGLVDVDLSAGDGAGLEWLDPAQVAAIAVDAVREGRRYAITHPGWLDVVVARHRAIERAFVEHPES